MPSERPIRASLEVGFGDGGLPARYERFRGVQHRKASGTGEIPFEGGQFDVVVMAGGAVSGENVKEAHRVLKPGGSLLFTVGAGTRGREGFALPGIYAMVRYGFDIVSAEKTPWWRFGAAKTISIEARKKNWKALNASFRPYA